MVGFSVTLAEAVGLGSSLALSGLCYYLYRKSRVTVVKLDNAPRLAVDGNLKDILKVTPGACLQYVVIEGAVKPVGQPLTSHFHKENVGVLQRFMVREHRLVWNSLSRSWTDDDRVLHERLSAVPFLLVGSDETTVRVLCPLQASGVYMETTHEKFQQGVYGFGDLVGQYLSGEKPKGQLEIEEMLKVGATLTGVGELVLDAGDGSLSLRPPSNGSEYFLSVTDIDALREESENVAVLWKTLLVISAMAGAAVLFWVGLRYYRHRRALLEEERERREFEGLRAEALGPQASGPRDGADDSCVICLGRPRDCVLLDCGHVCCCYSCYRALPRRKCPICRQDINRVIPLFHT